MGSPAVGDVFVIRFPFSDLKHNKARPALVIAESDFGNVIVAQITSRLPEEASGVILESSDFKGENNLARTSYIRTNKLFTADKRLLGNKLGSIKMSKRKQVNKSLVDLFGVLVEK